MTCFQRIFHVHTKRQIFLLTQKADFPICLEVAFGPQPRESQGARRHSDKCPRQPSCSPAREEGPPLRICRGRRPQTARLRSRPRGRLLPLVGLARLGRLPSAALATSDARSPPPRPAVPAPQREPGWIVAVCLCLLKLGREKPPRSEDGLERTPEPGTDGSVSSGNGCRGWTRPRSGAAWLAQEHAVREGKPRGCRQDRGLLCAEAVLQQEALVPRTREKSKREALISLLDNQGFFRKEG